MQLRDVAVAGVYATEQARLLADRTSMDVALEAAPGALADAGLAPADVDGVALEWPGPGGAAGDAGSWAKLMGRPLSWTSDGLVDCGGVRGVAKAASAVATGLCETAVIGGGTAGRAMAERFATVSATADGSVHQFVDPWGAYVVPMFALVARRHMHEFGTTERQIATVSATIRNHGHVNPAAIMFGRGPYAPEDVLASRMISSPLRLLDCCLVGQGGAAIVVTTLERARDLRHPPVVLLGAGMEVAEGSYVDPPAYRQVGQLGRATARRVFAMAGVGPRDVDVFNLYDPTSFEVIRQFEVLGLCEEGEGGPFVEDGRIAMGGTHPTNLDGGLLSYAWNSVQQMTLKLVESVLQLRGDAGYRQVPDAEVAVATNSGSGAAHWEMAVLGRA